MVIPVTVLAKELDHALVGVLSERAMQRLIEEINYVLENLLRARQEVIAHPESFECDALQRIDKTIASMTEVKLAVEARVAVNAA